MSETETVMTSRDVGATIVRVVGVLVLVLVVSALPRLWNLVPFVRASDDEAMKAVLPGELAWAVGELVISGLLFACAPTIGRAFVRSDRAVGLAASAVDLQSALFAGVGLYLICSRIPMIALAVVRFSQARDLGARYGEAFLTQHRENLFMNIAVIVFGLALFIGARGVVNIWRRLRSAGT